MGVVHGIILVQQVAQFVGPRYRLQTVGNNLKDEENYFSKSKQRRNVNLYLGI